ncbi:prephenate dehydratase domain-containing protein [Candidatus Neomarinimicrobiota bacterium]
MNNMVVDGDHIRIGLQGAKGSFSEEAGIDFASRHGLADYAFDYLVSSEKVMEALDEGTINYGIIAMENAQGGVVIESVIALARHACEIAEMFHIQVEQCLLGKHGLAVGDITAIHSHPQALRQCRIYLADHFWTRPLIEEDHTAAAAARLSAGELPETTAVIGGRNCAELYDLDILTENIQDLKNNLTLFLGLKK